MANAKKPDHDTVLIKKYPNRRLYNTKTSAYIVLDDIVDLIKSDTPFVIQDKKTGEDITRSILNQIIFERETANKQYHFPLEVQKQLIGMYDDAYASMIPDYLQQSLDLFTSEREKIKQTMQDVMGANTKAMMDFSQNLAQQNLKLFRQSMEIFSAPLKSDKTDDEKVDQNKNKNYELDEIQEKIDALQNRLQELK